MKSQRLTIYIDVRWQGLLSFLRWQVAASSPGGKMRDQKRVVEYARTLSHSMSDEMHWQEDEYGSNGGYWVAAGDSYHRIVARGTAALEFFRQYAGETSIWTKRANETYETGGEGQSTATGVRALGDLLRAWAEQVDAGIIEVAGSQEWATGVLVSTDVMSQVRRLNEDKSNHPAAAIVLCGAALEIALRALALARAVQLPSKPSINLLSGALRQAGVLSPQDVKDIESLGGVRNSAAHGQFADLTSERAGLMEQHTNLLLRRLQDLHP